MKILDLHFSPLSVPLLEPFVIATATITHTRAVLVALFALFHDSRRVNEYGDEGHGLRGARFAKSLRGRLVHLEDARFELLFEACQRGAGSVPRFVAFSIGRGQAT